MVLKKKGIRWQDYRSWKIRSERRDSYLCLAQFLLFAIRTEFNFFMAELIGSGYRK